MSHPTGAPRPRRRIRWLLMLGVLLGSILAVREILFRSHAGNSPQSSDEDHS